MGPCCTGTDRAGTGAPPINSLFPGIYESDDINAIVSEMEKALNYSQKVCFGVGMSALASILFLGLHTKCHEPGA